MSLATNLSKPSNEFEMDLIEKGAPSGPEENHLLTARIQWQSSVDFDLAAGYETIDGKQGLVYYGNQGDLNRFPFIELLTDDGVGSATGPHKEILRVAQLDEMKFLWLFCWDYGQIQTGEAARFDKETLGVSVEMAGEETFEASFDSVEAGNVCLIATVDKSEPDSVRVDKTCKAGTLAGLRNLSQLLAIVNA